MRFISHYCIGCPKKYGRLINKRAKSFPLIFKISFILSKARTNLEFEIKTRQLKSDEKSSEIYYFEVEHSKFYEPNFDSFEVVNF